MAVSVPETFRLDHALYIGIGIDVFLAIVAGVLIYKWRKRKKEQKERSRQVDRLYGTSQRTEFETLHMDSRSVSRVVGPGSVRHSQHAVSMPNPLYMTQNSVIGSSKSNNADSVGVRNSYVSGPDSGRVSVRRNSYVNPAYDDSPENPHYDPSTGDDRVIRNPLAGQAMSPNMPESDHAGDMSVSTYYTYKPPVKQLDGESSEVLSLGEKSPLSSPPPDEYLDLNDERSRSPPPPPLPVYEGNEYSLPDDTSAAGDRTSWSTLNFGQESVAKLYTGDFDESTQIM